MAKRILCLNTIEKVKQFVNIVNKYDFIMDLKGGRYIVDAKSIMGIFSLNLCENIEFIVHTDEETGAELLSEIEKFEAR